MVVEAVRRRCHASNQVQQHGGSSQGGSCQPLRTTTGRPQDDQTGRPQDDHRTTQRGGRKGSMPGPIHHSEFCGCAAMPLATPQLVPIRAVPAQPARPAPPGGSSRRRRRRLGDSSPAAGPATSRHSRHRQHAAAATDRRSTATRRRARQAYGQARARRGGPYWWRSWTLVAMGIMAHRASHRFRSKNRPRSFRSVPNNCQSIGDGQIQGVEKPTRIK